MRAKDDHELTDTLLSDRQDLMLLNSVKLCVRSVLINVIVAFFESDLCLGEHQIFSFFVYKSNFQNWYLQKKPMAD